MRHIEKGYDDMAVKASKIGFGLSERLGEMWAAVQDRSIAK